MDLVRTTNILCDKHEAGLVVLSFGSLGLEALMSFFVDAENWLASQGPDGVSVDLRKLFCQSLDSLAARLIQSLEAIKSRVGRARADAPAFSQFLVALEDAEDLLPVRFYVPSIVLAPSH
jgi:hypothetical protein